MEPPHKVVRRLIREALEAAEGLERSREAALVKTKLDEAQMWSRRLPEVQRD